MVHPGGLGLNHRNTLKTLQKSSSPEPFGSDACNLLQSIPSGSLLNLFKFLMKVSGFKMTHPRVSWARIVEIHRTIFETSQVALCQRVFSLNHRKTLKSFKISFFRITCLRCLKFGMYHCLMVLY